MARLRDTEGGATTSHATPGDHVQQLEQDPSATSHGQLQQQVPTVTTDEQVDQHRTAGTPLQVKSRVEVDEVAAATDVPKETQKPSTSRKVTSNKALKTSAKKTKAADTGKTKHYSSRACPLCKKIVCNLARHLTNVHVKKNKCIPEARIKPLMQMARHGNLTAERYQKKKKDGTKKTYQRRKDICYRCDSVVLYLSKHLRNVHGLHKEFLEYETAMILSCPYEGRSQEIKWDKRVIERKRKGTKEIPTSSKRSRQQEEDTGEDDLQEEDDTPPHPLNILFQELSSDDDSDSSCHFDPELELPTPQKSTGSIMTRQKPTVKTEPTIPDDYEAGGVARDDHDTSSQTGGKEQDNEEDDDETSEEGGEEHASDQTFEESESSDTDEDSEAFQTWTEYYQEAKGKTEKETLLIKYCHHLQDILSGCKKPTHAVWHAQNVRRIKDATDSPGQYIEILSPRWRP